MHPSLEKTFWHLVRLGGGDLAAGEIIHQRIDHELGHARVERLALVRAVDDVVRLGPLGVNLGGDNVEAQILAVRFSSIETLLAFNSSRLIHEEVFRGSEICFLPSRHSSRYRWLSRRRWSEGSRSGCLSSRRSCDRRKRKSVINGPRQ